MNIGFACTAQVVQGQIACIVDCSFAAQGVFDVVTQVEQVRIGRVKLAAVDGVGTGCADNTRGNVLNLTGEGIARLTCFSGIDATNGNRTVRACSGSGIVAIQRVVTVVVRFSQTAATQCNIVFINGMGFVTQGKCFDSISFGVCTQSNRTCFCRSRRYTQGDSIAFRSIGGMTDSNGFCSKCFSRITKGNRAVARCLGVKTHRHCIVF